jgi:hypothetical protein
MRYAATLKGIAVAAVIAGAAIPSTPALAATGSTCTFSPNATPARVDVYDGSGTRFLGIGRSGQFITVTDAGSPTKLCAGPNGNATLLNTDQIIVHGNNATSNDAYVVDTLGPGKTPEADGNSELETVINSSVPTLLTVHGTGVRDIMRVGGGGGVMLGSDVDVDVRSFSADEIALAGHDGNDYLSGRGGYPASIPGPATVPVAMIGGEGDDTLVDGPLSQDELSGEGGNDMMFSADGKPLDHTFGGSGFDQVTLDDGDFHTQDIESVKVAG